MYLLLQEKNKEYCPGGMSLWMAFASLRSKRFRRVWEQRKTEELLGILPARKMGREPKKERWG